ncbi:MFS transporter [Pseudomonas sp. S31]|uniref:MFS transporter n=1 Tax=Pseudomonas sp. S31 TaxID=1564473 RepID=UPI001911ADA1|nr:MFS transporter [Pseudomonas sp. S31]MBK4998068.1 MFS transporter [Pseudomonas sp. S31]
MQALILNRGTRVLASGYCFSKCGEFAFEAAFAVAIVSVTNADMLLIGMAYFFRYLPTVVFSPLGGWLADNVDKRKTLVSVEISKSVVAFAFFTLSAVYTLALPMMVSLAMVMTALECLYVPTFRAYFPDLIEKNRLASANSGIQVIEDAASIVGPLVFAACVLLLSREATFLFFAICLVASGISIATLEAPRQGLRQEFDGPALFRGTVQSLSQLKASNAPLFAVISCTTLCATFATSVIRFILPATVLDHFASEEVVGYVFALLAAGTVLGGVLYTRFNNKTTVRLVLRYWVIYGALFFAAAVALKFSSWLFLMTLFMVGFVGAFIDIAIVTNIQCLSSDHEVGRNFSVYYFTAVLGDAASGLIASLVFVFAGSATFIWMTLMLFVAPMAWNMRGRDDDADNR